MKTPREILFERHRSAEPKLNDIRRQTLAALPNSEGRSTLERKTRSGLSELVREFIRSFRWHLAGLSAAWLLVVVLSVEPSPAARTALAHTSAPPPARQVLAALREQRRQLWALLEPAAPPPPAVPQASSPRRGNRPTLTLAIA